MAGYRGRVQRSVPAAAVTPRSPVWIARAVSAVIFDPGGTLTDQPARGMDATKGR